MESLIVQAFAHVENLADHVNNGHYDLLGPDKEIIMPQYWDTTVEPDMHVTMMLWPLPEKKDDGIDIIPPPGDDGLLNLDDILNPGGGGGGDGGGGGGRRRGGGGSKKKRPTSRGPGTLGLWMLGGGSTKKSSLKGDKKPDGAAGFQIGMSDDTCTVM